MGKLEELLSSVPPEQDLVLPALVMQVMHASHSYTTSVMDSLLDVYKKEAEEYKAELATIRHNVARAMSGPWMPTSNHIMTCLYPTREEIQEFLDEQRGSM